MNGKVNVFSVPCICNVFYLYFKSMSDTKELTRFENPERVTFRIPSEVVKIVLTHPEFSSAGIPVSMLLKYIEEARLELYFCIENTQFTARPFARTNYLGKLYTHESILHCYSMKFDDIPTFGDIYSYYVMGDVFFGALKKMLHSICFRLSESNAVKTVIGSIMLNENAELWANSERPGSVLMMLYHVTTCYEN